MMAWLTARDPICTHISTEIRCKFIEIGVFLAVMAKF
uniref:Uncharacterized protein n=1 Tax=Setaria viridis TaxID=4556 RepID=A0A4U6TYQ9_SETVI|nr:hypothetical protein SEVIR_7G313333v2 [Setaria viridis]